MAVICLLKAVLLACLVSSAVSSVAIENIAQDLQPLLSADAQIYFPGSQGYKNATNRWASAVKPGLDVVIKIASEADVQNTILYANAHRVPFLTIGGGHGSSSALNAAQGAIGIWMRGLNGTVLAPGTNGTQAIIQAGSLSGEVIEAFWDLGKQGTAGGCDCTSFTGPMLGGGHGILQGQYGFLADNIVSARVVLANGTAISVSDAEHADLFWGLRGAGHNFGVVMSFHYQVHDLVPGMDGYATANFTFTQDRLEAVFTIANSWIETADRPVELMHYGIFAIRPTVDPQPVVVLLVFWQGATIPTTYTDPLVALGPISIVEKWVDFRGVNAIAGADKGGPDCVEGLGRQLFPTNLYTWNVTNLRAVLDIFASFPAYLNGSLMLLEGYPVNRVQAIPANSTAYPDRSHNILASPLLQYPPNNATLDLEVAAIGRKIRSAMEQGVGPLAAYVNYAHGDENNLATYGYESWRLERLRALKRAYDPHNQFSFFEPIRE